MYQIFTTGVLTSLGVQAWPCSKKKSERSIGIKTNTEFFKLFSILMVMTVLAKLNCLVLKMPEQLLDSDVSRTFLFVQTLH